MIEWQYVKENASLANTLNAMFMGLFSILGLAAVGMIIFNTIGGQVLSQYREIGLLKAVGFSPRQVTLLFLGEHLAIGLVAALLGILLGLGVAPGLVERMARKPEHHPPDIYTARAADSGADPGRDGRCAGDPAPGLARWAHRHGAGHQRGLPQPAWPRPSRLGRLAGWLRLPPVVVLGVKDTFSRPLRSRAGDCQYAADRPGRHHRRRRADHHRPVGPQPFLLQRYYRRHEGGA